MSNGAMNNDTNDNSAQDQRLTKLEIKATYTEDLLEQLDAIIVRQQQQIDLLVRKVQELQYVRPLQPSQQLQEVQEVQEVQELQEQNKNAGDTISTVGENYLQNNLPPHFSK